MIQQVVLVIHFILAFGIIGLVLLQHGKGAEVGASFGSGASQTLFGSQGSTSFLAKITALFALGFALSSLSLGYLKGHHHRAPTLLERIEAQQAQELPAIPNADKKVKNAINDDEVNHEVDIDN